MVDVRSYRADTDRDGLWRCKRAFETGLGATGDDAKEQAYEAKITDSYRDRYLAWVERCVEAESGCVHVAVDEADVVGYVFVLPETHAMIWDAAVINEIYVSPGFRGSGVADDLLTTALEHARRQNLPLDRIILDVDEKNERAQAFYDRHGFESWGELVARDL